MNFVHFLKSQRYRSRVPLRQLQFTVTVYRALVVEEAHAELLAEATVPWDGKAFSPLEVLDLYRDLSRLTRQPPHAEELKEQTTETAPPAAAATSGAGPSTPGPAAARASCPAPSSDEFALPTPCELVAQLQQPQSSFFTRPTLEDFIDCAEEDFPVDPPQGPSLLAPIILRQHRRDHQPNRKMYLMWASGEVVLPEGMARALGPAAAAAAESTSSGDARASAASLPPLDADAISWQGVERVLCTLTAEPDESVFTARPSLNDVHTLFVDAAHIYTFRVTVSKAAARGETHPGMSLGVTPKGALDAASTPLDIVLANVRELAQYTEEQCEKLEVSKDAVARRLLRQAAMMVPPERGTSGPAVMTASGALSSEEGGRARRASFNFGGPSGALGEGGVGTAMGGLSVPAAQRGTGVGGALLSRPAVMRSGRLLPRGICQYYVFGTVDRCVGIPESTLFLRCQLVEDGATTAWMYDPLATSTPSAVLEFSSQLAHISTFVEHECVLDVDHIFNLPFEYSFVGTALPRSPLRLVVSAFTEGMAAEGIQSAVAYTCVSLPVATPGRHAVAAAMWAPHKTSVEFLQSTLIGGAPSLVDARQAGPPPSHQTGLNVKAGLYADSVGSVRLTVNVLHHRGHDDV
ncbi:hypothetical protein ABL78_3796 [Leptomonas seymouri]|uniref:Meckel syndrome type 1 protein n=1 Tax=Leptomonas seymouri TaxID=5684 RepID=A0A0N1I7B5_LEPSE|nr:hypothetical protein ABL78_3796 [Leptomonas seymouri]|eukprot:KPI87143.1 hypothetical protein ABL78_3796 [Leptomonas seymouri]